MLVKLEIPRIGVAVNEKTGDGKNRLKIIVEDELAHAELAVSIDVGSSSRNVAFNVGKGGVRTTQVETQQLHRIG